jgi:hypothetical protein
VPAFECEDSYGYYVGPPNKPTKFTVEPLDMRDMTNGVLVSDSAVIKTSDGDLLFLPDGTFQLKK